MTGWAFVQATIKGTLNSEGAVFMYLCGDCSENIISVIM